MTRTPPRFVLDVPSSQARIKQLLRERHLSILRAAELCSLAYSTLYNVVNANREPGLIVLVRIARGLGVSMDWLCCLDLPIPQHPEGPVLQIDYSQIERRVVASAIESGGNLDQVTR